MDAVSRLLPAGLRNLTEEGTVKRRPTYKTNTLVLVLLACVMGCSDDVPVDPVRVARMQRGYGDSERAVVAELAAEHRGFATQFSPPPSAEMVSPGTPVSATPGASSPGSSLPFPSVVKMPPRVTDEAVIAGGTSRVTIGSDEPITSAFKASLLELNELKPISDLRISSRSVSDEDLSFLSELTELDLLSLECEGITDETMNHVAELGNLMELRVVNCPITDDGVRVLSDMTRLYTIWLQRTEVTGTAFSSFGASQVLQSLSLTGSPISDDGLKSIAKIPKLASISANRTQVTDAGLKHVADMPNLFLLNVESTRVTNRAGERLQKQRPRLKVLY